MSLAHESWIVLLSVLMAVQGSYVGLYLARQVGQARGTRYRQLITFSALSLALGVWTMHFLGMLALQLPFSANFLVLPTLISFLVCIPVIAVAVFVVGRPRPSSLCIVVAALFMGSGIVAMHYIGMLALHAGMHMTYSPVLVTASVAVGIAAAGLSLWLGFAEAAPRSIAGSAL
ncbi:MAG: MHYT domain-containing protein, partial [Janthinobacterium lividum]